MKLIGSRASPFVRKVRIVMAEKKLDYDFFLEDVWAPDTTILQSNPLGKVPCLVMEDGASLFDSRVIVEYLDTLTPVCKLIPVQSRERAEVKCWEALADGVADAGVMIRLEETLRDPEHRSSSWVDRQMAKIHAGLHAMSVKLDDTPFCTGKNYTLSDVAVGCTLGWLAYRFPHIQWQSDYPNLSRLFEKLSERPSFKDTSPH